MNKKFSSTLLGQ
jgi:hypothetical protein